MDEPKATIRLKNSRNGTDNSGMCVTPYIVATDKLPAIWASSGCFVLGSCEDLLFGVEAGEGGGGQQHYPGRPGKNLCGYHRKWSPYQGHCGGSLPRWPDSWAVGSGGQGLVRAYPEFFLAVGGLGEGVADWVWWEESLCDFKHERQMWANLQPRRCCIEPPTNGLTTGGVIFRLWMLARLGYLWCLGLVCGCILSQVELHHVSAVSTKTKSERGLWFPVLCVVLYHRFP